MTRIFVAWSAYEPTPEAALDRLERHGLVKRVVLVDEGVSVVAASAEIICRCCTDGLHDGRDGCSCMEACSMGWHNRVLSELQQMKEALGVVDTNLGKHTTDVKDLDEVCRGFIALQGAAAEALGEIYESCGPFFPRKKA